MRHSFFSNLCLLDGNLTEDDLKFLRPFTLKVNMHMPGVTFAQLPLAFPNSNISMWKEIQAHAAWLSSFDAKSYPCCINLCCAYTGPHVDKTTCPYCSEPQNGSSGKPRKVFIYLPVIPQLKAFLVNKTMAKEMSYCSQAQDKHTPGTILNVTDSTNYQSLLSKQVTVDTKQLPHKFFEDLHDVTLGLSMDSFAPFKQCTKMVWPLLLMNYNLWPEIRNHLENLIGIGVIPGPKKPTNFDLFLWPLVQELLQLEVGVHTYNSLTDVFFALRAYLILVFGDIPAISMVMRMKGHNGSCPCRMCEIRGVRIPDSRNPIHYVPLDRARHPDLASQPDAIPSYDPKRLPLRTHSKFIDQANKVQFATTEADSERFAKQYGIKGLSILTALSSLSFPSSFPYDFMHLIWENVAKNLMSLWTGNYKDLDTGSESYGFPSTIWDAIGAATAALGDLLPYIFGPRPPNVASDKMSWTADTRCFWIQYIAPVVLQGRFLQDKYYDHFVDFVRLVNICLCFELTTADVEEVQCGFVSWVRKYEEYVSIIHCCRGIVGC